MESQQEQVASSSLDWSLLPPEVQESILARLPLNKLVEIRLVCKRFAQVWKSGTFHQERARLCPTECSLSPLVIYAANASWHVAGHDLNAQIWRNLSPFKPLIPAPDPDLFKDFHVAGDKGLVCVNVGKASEEEKLYVCNPLTGETNELPALKFPRHPVIMCMHAALCIKEDRATSRFWIIAIGSAAYGAGSLSRKTEVYDSITDKWEGAGDVPGVGFSSSDEKQSGVFCESQNLLLCVGAMVNGCQGILAFDVETRKWREDWICPFYQPEDTGRVVRFHSAKLVGCSCRIYLFSEQGADGSDVAHCIDKLDVDSRGYLWTRMVTQPREMWRATRKLLNNEYTCVPVGENKLCVFNTFEPTRPGVVYDMLAANPMTSRTSLVISPSHFVEKGITFRTLESQGCIFNPSFGISAKLNFQGVDGFLGALPDPSHRNQPLNILPVLDMFSNSS